MRLLCLYQLDLHSNICIQWQSQGGRVTWYKQILRCRGVFMMVLSMIKVFTGRTVTHQIVGKTYSKNLNFFMSMKSKDSMESFDRCREMLPSHMQWCHVLKIAPSQAGNRKGGWYTQCTCLDIRASAKYEVYHGDINCLKYNF